ncbi:MAG: hypothetical protein AB7K52_06485 [Phycisphaerales bacterium]
MREPRPPHHAPCRCSAPVGAVGAIVAGCVGIALLGASSHAGDPPEPRPRRPISEFIPSRHGFRFSNAFAGSPLPTGLEAVGALAGAPSRYGLCGGMSFAAADHFLARREIPQNAEAPRRGDALFDLLYRRQVESFDGLAAPMAFADWMARADRGPLGVQHLTAACVPGMLDELRAQRPVVLGLVHARSGQPLWHNHQVLAFAAEPIPGGPSAGDRGWVLRVYDPNHPENDRVEVRCRSVVAGWLVVPGPLGVSVPVIGLDCRLIAAEMPERGRRARERVVRGMFAMPYSPADVPDRPE